MRHYHRGGAAARLLGDRYLRLGTPRPVREFRMGRALETLGIPTPRVIGAAVYPAGPFYRGDLVTAYVPDGDDLAAVLFGMEQLPSPEGGVSTAAVRVTTVDPGAAMTSAGRLVARLHTHGVLHNDLNIKNILVVPEPGGAAAYILDLDRARLRARLSTRARSRMLRRFWRSVAKWERRSGRTLEPPVREAFEDAYQGTLGPG